jgi:ABC-type branched-subunit amino acid transport system ATPase component
MADTRGGAVLEIADLDVYYGRAHALQGVTLRLERGVTAIVGRNGMGKTTLCNAITGLIPATGSVRLAGEQILGRSAHEITRRGIAYVPQGRRTWASLTVDEHLRLVARGGSGRWSVERIYSMFPRLAERKSNGGAQLSGGEQQMLAIGRALLLDPRLLVMDEPTEGLAPVIVEQVVDALRRLAAESEIAVLLVEQNLGVAIDVADRVAVMVNGRIARELAAAELAADRELQERLLGVRSAGEEETPVGAPAAADEGAAVQVLTVRRAFDDGAPRIGATTPREVRGLNRWNAADPAAPLRDLQRGASRSEAEAAPSPPSALEAGRVYEFPVAASAERAAYVAGTFDTKGR